MAGTAVNDYTSINTTGAVNSCFGVSSPLQNSENSSSLRSSLSQCTTMQIQKARRFQLNFIDCQAWGAQGASW